MSHEETFERACAAREAAWAKLWQVAQLAAQGDPLLGSVHRPSVV